MLLITISCKHSDKTTLNKTEYPDTPDTVYIKNSDKIENSFWYADKYIDMIGVFGLQVDERLAIECQSSYLEIEQDVDAPIYWLKKGGEYNIYSTGRDNAFSCSDSILNNEISFLACVHDSIMFHLGYRSQGGVIMMTPTFTNNLKQNVLHIKSKELYDSKLSLLESYESKLSPSFHSLIKQNFLWEYLCDLIWSYNSNYSSENLKQQLKKEICQSALTYQNDSLLFSGAYREGCDIANRLLASDYGDDIGIDKLFASAEKNFTGRTRNYILLQRVKACLSNNQNMVTEVEKLLLEIENEEYKDYKDYKDYIISQINQTKMQGVIKDSDLLLTMEMDTIPLKEVIGRYKGKIIYVDFWASWCAPCRSLFPKSLQLQEQLSSDIIFLYISKDQNSELWLKASNYERISRDKSFLISNQSEFVENNKINTIPRYMIFDRAGKLIDNNAMRPDDKDFVEKMNRIINQK